MTHPARGGLVGEARELRALVVIESTARVIASVPKRSRSSSRVESSVAAAVVERELTGPGVLEVREGDANEGDPSVLDRRLAPRRAAPARRRARVSVRSVASSSVCERVAREKSEKRSRRTTVRHTRRALRSRPVTRSTSADQDRVHRLGRARAPAERVLGADRAPRRRRSTRRGSRTFASACSWRPAPRPSISTSTASPSSATWPTVLSPASWSRAAVFGPTPQSRSTGSG